MPETVPEPADFDGKNPEARGPQVEVRVYIPERVAKWLDEKASEHFKSRAKYIRDLLIGMFLKATRSNDA